MRTSRLVLLVVAALLLQPGAALGQSAATQGSVTEYVVLYAQGPSLDAARQAVAAVGGQVVKENAAVGVATVRSTNPSFLRDVGAQAALAGAARNAPIGREAPIARPNRDTIESLTATERGSTRSANRPGKGPQAEPLADLQWDMAMIHATPTGSYRKEPGDRGVRVGIIDTGVDGSHPDIAPNFDAKLSRNFTTDIPSIDGPCESATCVDQANEDDNGHGTHVAGTIGAAVNGLGIAGVAPGVTLVNLRAGQDSGYFFLQPSIDALTYAGDNGIDVVNMSYYIDPWLFNCAANPADSPEQQMEQRTIIAATNRALDYAYRHGVTLIVAAGNDNTDLDHPTFDGTSPDFPPGMEYGRDVDNSCLIMPAEGHHVIEVSSVGPSTNKADYSNWGLHSIQVSAPGGFFRDYAGTPQNRTIENLTLSAYPESLALEDGFIDAPGAEPNSPSVVRDCQQGTCAYYQYLQGTSMAAPHAAGVAALIVSRYGDPDHGWPRRQLRMDPSDVERILTRTATDHACPVPALISYADVGRGPEFDALCEGTARFNSIWGHGIVDALAAVSGRR